ncbi:hypothetical protein ABT116_12840 [Streptomyces sp. NPDC002130]|uniref:hypothetical protein n=1 Tax=Streptomyces sp. NPDC002130 TaxID=3155568 RepID=UPI00332FB39C
MHWALVGVAVVCVTVMAAGGVAAVLWRWVPPFGRDRALRPKLWGAGVLMSAAGLGLFMFLGPLGAEDPAVNFAVPLAGMGINFAGLAVQTLARRPGRVT